MCCPCALDGNGVVVIGMIGRGPKELKCDQSACHCELEAAHKRAISCKGFEAAVQRVDDFANRRDRFIIKAENQ